ncbi:MAG: hypothetical protein COX65_03315 [Elusimicrobia bacterium CG_4_10_14_0_2_um_filter_56_8]|nr:MAG: hypothetical protein AUJ51_01200 [Elusimicrobia bacterium CG1_02_56_21]PJA16039.1 MAG: hypothetical protein COX65_03315 [Elusimicrobia bacterium CG_4_10_14_0_2_um_filter_56_8]
MWRSLAISFLSFPFSLPAFFIGWALRDLRFGLLAGAVVFTGFFIAALVSLFFVKTYNYFDAALPPVFAVLWSLALAPFSFGASLFSAPAFISAGFMLGACMVLAKRYETGIKWLAFPVLVFIYEMLPVNIPGPVDDTFAVAGSVGSVLLQFMRSALPQILKEQAGKRNA